MRLCAHWLIVCSLAALVFASSVSFGQPGSGPGFALLDQRSEVSVNQGLWLHWVNPPIPPGAAPGPTAGTPRGGNGRVTLSYAIDSQFMANLGAAGQAAAQQAVVSALSTWSRASNGYVRFDPAPWDAVENADSIFHSFFAGPSLDWWCLNYCISCQGCPGGTQPLPNPINLFPGWGADIDIFSRSTGFTIVSNGITYSMDPGVLGFTVVHRSAGGIWSVDIYLNHDFVWTNNAAAASAWLGPALGGPRTDTDDDGTQELLTTDAKIGQLRIPPGLRAVGPFDVETVVLHELGHALGLDHPNESCAAGGAVLDPWLFTSRPCGNWSASQVMHGNYTGAKRQLTDSDVGGLAFLYLPGLLGDLDGDGRMTISDGIAALALLDSPSTATPYDINTLDFIHRNGRIDLVEVSQQLLWIIDPLKYPPGIVQALNTPGQAVVPGQLTVSSSAIPTDIGIAASVDVVISAGNPDLIPIQGWDMRVLYDSAIFSNPRVLDGTILAGMQFFPPVDGSPGARIAKIGFFPETPASGVLGVLRLDVNLAAAALAPAQTSFTLSGVAIVVTTVPNPHNFGDIAGEAMITVSGSAQVFHYDANGDGIVTPDDLYAAQLVPIDVNKDTIINQIDHDVQVRGVRNGELIDTIANR